MPTWNNTGVSCCNYKPARLNMTMVWCQWYVNACLVISYLNRRAPLSREELELIRQYLELIQLEFSEFKRKLADEGIPVRSFVSAIKTHELMVTIPNPRFFNEFMMVLAKKNLLPHPSIAEQQKLKQRAQPVQIPQEEIAQEQRFHPSPFDSLRKGPRPKGYKESRRSLSAPGGIW